MLCRILSYPCLVLFGLVLTAVFDVPAIGFAQSLPALPATVLETTYGPPTTGITIIVNAGGDLQAALDQALPGDIIELEAGATFTGNFTLPDRPGTGWIYIRSSDHASLPPPGTRVSPAQASLMPQIVTPNTAPAISTASAAHHYRFVGIEITGTHATTASTLYNLVLLEDQAGQVALSQVPTDIVFDRCYIHGTPTGNLRRGIAVNSARTAVIDSYVSDVHEVGADSQAIAGWNGPGPFKIVNNYVEGAGENLMFGGADPRIADLVPSDIEIRRNHFSKPLSWRVGDPSYAGIHWTVKNLFELKNARRVLIDGNLFENNWQDAQGGTAILFTVRNQDGSAPWSTVEDVTFTNNIVRHAGSGIGMHGWDDLHPSQQSARFLIKNNLLYDIDSVRWGGMGRLFNAFKGIDDLVIDHNTGLQDGSVLFADGGTHTRFVYRNNLTPHNEYGVHGTGTAPGTLSLDFYFPGHLFARNNLWGGNLALYPPDNFFPMSASEVGFVDLAGGDYRLTDASPYKQAGTDGKNLGADIDALGAATACASTGACGDPSGSEGSSGSGEASGSDGSTATVSASPISLAFGSVPVGATSTPGLVWVINDGSGGITVSSLTASDPFKVSSTDCYATSGWDGVMPPGTHCNVYVVFAPTTSGSATGTLKVTAGGSSLAVPLSGTGATTSTTATTSSSSTDSAPTLPQLPRVLLDTTYAAPAGSEINVPAGGDFQAALNQAQRGSVIVLQAGATYTGNFTLPAKSGTGWVYIQSSALSNLPPPGTRVGPAQASFMPKLVSPNTSAVLVAGSGAQFYRFVGIEFTTTSGTSSSSEVNSLISLGTGSDLVLDRTYIHGSPTQYVRRGVVFNNARAAIIDSYVGEIHINDGDSQAIIGWDGPGPFKIVNNYLEAAAENIMFGGADPSVTGLVPSDIEVRRNHLRKPLSWRPGDPSYAGMNWTIKNLFELKNAQRVLVDGNLLEQNWVDPDAAYGFQLGPAFVLTVRNQGGNCPWCVVQDVTITNNIVRHVGQGMGMSSTEGAGGRRFLIRNNLFDDVNSTRWGAPTQPSNGRLFNNIRGLSDVTIDHNTGFQDGAVVYNADTYTLVYTNNLTLNGGGAPSALGPNTGFAGSVAPSAYPAFAKNVVVGGDAAGLPPDNFFPLSLDAVGFVDLAGGNYALAASSLYKNAGTDGKDIGADLEALNSVTACALSGACANPPLSDTTPPTTGVSLSPTSLSFGSVPVGTTSAEHNVWVTNTGTTGLSVSGLTVSGPFAVSSTDCYATSSWNGVMPPGTHCNVYVVFKPVSSDSATGTLTVTAAGSSQAVPLAGTGTPPPPIAVAVSPSSATVASGGTQQITATVSGTTNTAVTWTASAGTISSTGLYTAPTVSASTTATVTATSVADPAKSATASVTITAPSVSFSLSPTSVAFGSVPVGTTSATANVWVNNTGTTGLSVSGLTVSGPFAVSSTDCYATSSWNGVMPPGTHCNVYVVFKPVSSDSATGTLTVTAGGVSITAALSGSGVSPFSLSPTSVAFGSVPVGTTSAEHIVWVTNTGTTGLSVSSLTVAGPFALSRTDCSPTATWNGSMPPGTHCNVYVVFAPVTADSATGTLTVTAAGSSQAVPLAGTGTN